MMVGFIFLFPLFALAHNLFTNHDMGMRVLLQ